MAWRSGGPARAALSAAPVPAGPLVRGDGELIGGLRWTTPGHVRARRRLIRRIRRLVWTVMTLAVLAAVLFAEVLMLTPGVGDAPALARALARDHGVVYPGPPVPQRAAASLIATQDPWFYTEPGIDPGGSTLYQQLAKMLYTPGRSGRLAQAQDVLFGIKLDFSYSKAEILQMYAAVAYFGHGYYGLADASCGYFGEDPAHLSWGQAAMLVGLVQAPSADDPVSHYANARAREAHVLARLVATGSLTQPQAIDAFRQTPHLASGPAAGCMRVVWTQR